MKRIIRNLLGVALVMLLASVLAACGSSGDAAGTPAGAVTNDGLTLTIPEEYAGLLLVETPQDSEDGILFTVSEQASIDAVKALGEDFEGAGWLFSIGRISEDELHQRLCGDLTGQEVFARDDNGSYYIFYHPTDVRLERENAEEMAAAAEQWSALNEWAWTVPETFVAENAGLTAESRGNTDLEICLNRIIYMDDTNYTISTLEFGPLSPSGVDPAPYVEQLLKGVTYEYAGSSEAPDGEYLVLAFPETGMRFDFFFGDENCIREIWGNEEDGNAVYYRAAFDDGSSKATEIMNDWYHALADANGAGPQAAEAMVGSWAEQIAGRGNIVISKGAEAGTYDVQITWGSSAFETAFWEMTATPSYDGSALFYENGKHSVVTFAEDGSASKEEVLYENGTGSFSLNDQGQLVWQDDAGQAGDDTVFIRAD